jgi:hypothetical protein
MKANRMDYSGRAVSERERGTSLLDRPVDLAAIPVQWVAWAAVLVVGLSIRLVGRTNWPLSPDESAVARDAYALVQGGDLSDAAAAQPALVQLTALMFFLFGDTDYTARLVPLIAGLTVVTVLFWSRRWFGNLPALSAAMLWSVSPVMTMSSMRLDGGVVLVLTNLIILVLVFALSVQGSTPRSILLGVVFAFALTVHPLGWLFAPVSLLLAILVTRDPEFRHKLAPAVPSFAVTLLLFTTFFATRPLGSFDFFRESSVFLWNEHLATLGSHWHLRLLALLVEEPAALILALTAIMLVLLRSNWSTTTPPALVIALTAWSIPLITLGLLLGGSRPDIFAVSLFPVILLGGFGLAMVVEGALKQSNQWRRISLAVVLGLGFVVALVRFLDLLSRGPDQNVSGWIVSALALGLLILLPLGVLALRLIRELGYAVMPMALLAVVLIFGAIQIRSSVLLPSTTADRPGEILVAGSSAPAVAQISQRIRAYSRDVTTHIQDVRDPTGGHGLMIVVDEELEDPFAWYFRDFPNLVIVEWLDDLDPEIAADVMISERGPSEQFLDQSVASYGSVGYPANVHLPASFGEARIRDGINAVVNPLEYRENFNYLIYRETATPARSEEFTLTLREDHARVLWGWLPE